MPFLMVLGTCLAALGAAIALLLAVLGALGVASIAVGAHETEGLERAIAVDVLFLFAVLLVATAYGFWNERTWARPLALAFWLSVACGSSLGALFWKGEEAAAMLIQAMASVIALAIAAWYFYVNESTVAYYRRLGPRRTTASAATP